MPGSPASSSFSGIRTTRLTHEDIEDALKINAACLVDKWPVDVGYGVDEKGQAE
jgi:hypothetical protein